MPEKRKNNMKHLLFVTLLLLAGWWLFKTLVHSTPLPIPATSPLAQLSGIDQEYYRQVFDYTMTAVTAGESYSWQAPSGKGAITVADIYQSKSGSVCRTFSERISVHGKESLADGIACSREGGKGWCRLKKGQAETCALEEPPTVIDNAARGIGDALDSTKNMLHGVMDRLR